MPVYYNENEPYAAAWLQNLIAAGQIAPGDVDERSIADVRADDLRSYTQAHFFAGIGGWSYALRLAGWPDDQPVWTGSCPCQPFSTAGQGKAFSDERHLWPAWFRLIRVCRPSVVLGEQVAAAIGWGWLDAVCADLEGEGYATGAAVLPACGVGAPHIRQRLWFVANANAARRRAGRAGEAGSGRDAPRLELAGLCDDSRMAHADGGHPGAEGLQRGGQQRQQPQDGGTGFMEHTEGEQVGFPRRARQPRATAGELGNPSSNGHEERLQYDTGRQGVARTQGESWSPAERPGASPWSDLVWLPCSDGKARPTQPGIQPLAHGVSARVGKLRAAGNAIVPQVAAQFIKAAYHD